MVKFLANGKFGKLENMRKRFFEEKGFHFPKKRAKNMPMVADCLVFDDKKLETQVVNFETRH